MWFRGLVVSSIPLVLNTAASLALGAQQPSPKKAPVKPTSAWTLTSGRSRMTDEPTVILTTSAQNAVRGWIQTTRPALIVRCQEGNLEVYLHTGLSSDVEEDGAHTVRYRIDKNDAILEDDWSESTSRDALFSAEPEVLFRRMVEGSSILFEWTPFNASPVRARFSIARLGTYRERIKKACPNAAIADDTSSVALAPAPVPVTLAARDAAIAALAGRIDASAPLPIRVKGSEVTVTQRVGARNACSLELIASRSGSAAGAGVDTTLVNFAGLSEEPQVGPAFPGPWLIKVEAMDSAAIIAGASEASASSRSRRFHTLLATDWESARSLGDLVKDAIWKCRSRLAP